MAEKVSFSVEVSTEDAIRKTGSLKAAIKEAEKQAQQLSLSGFADEALTASRNAARLKEELNDVKDRIAALNPEAKFTAITQAAQGIAGGFAAAQGAMALFGTQSKEVEATLLKVQGAMALAEGLNSIRGLGDAFGNLKTIAVGAFNSIKTAIGSTGIGLLVVAIGAAVAAMWKWSEATDEQKKKQDELNASLEREKKVLETRNQILSARAKADKEYFDSLHKSEAEATAFAIAQLHDEEAAFVASYKFKLKELKANEAELKSLNDKIRGHLFGASDEEAEEKKRLEEKSRTLKSEADKMFEDLQTFRKREAALNNEADKKELDAAKEKAKELKKILDQRRADELKAWFEHNKFLESIHEARKKQEEDGEKDLTDKQNKYQEERKNNALASIQELGSYLQKSREDRLKAEQQAADEEAKINEARWQSAQAFTASIATLGNVLAKNEEDRLEFQKIATIAQIAYDTARAISTIVAESSSGDPYTAAFRIAANVAMVVANIAKATQVLNQAPGAKAKTFTVPSGGANAAPTPPNTQPQQVVGGTRITTNAPQQQNTAVKAYVVESELTDSQKRILKIKNNAKF